MLLLTRQLGMGGHSIDRSHLSYLPLGNFHNKKKYCYQLGCKKVSEHGHLRQWYKGQKYQLENGTLTKWREEMMIATFGVKWTWDPSIHDVEIYGVRYYDFIHDDCRKVAQRFREKR